MIRAQDVLALAAARGWPRIVVGARVLSGDEARWREALELVPAEHLAEIASALRTSRDPAPCEVVTVEEVSQ